MKYIYMYLNLYFIYGMLWYSKKTDKLGGLSWKF